MIPSFIQAATPIRIWPNEDDPSFMTFVRRVRIGELVCETKRNGFRCFGARNGSVEFRNKTWLPAKFPVPSEVERWVDSFPDSTVVDGELLTSRRAGRSESDPETGRYYVFDLLFFDGEDLRNLPLVERKSRLLSISIPKWAPVLILKWPTNPNLARLYKTALAAGHEGVCLKARSGRYGSEWYKVKALGT